MPRALVAAIAFNESPKLERVVQRFLGSSAAAEADFLVMDDGSTDGTDEIARRFADRGIRLLSHPRQRGVGAAIRTAIRHARTEGYEVMVVMAGNDKDEPEQIPDLLRAIEEGHDLVQGSRYLEGGSTGGDMPLYRRLATRLHPLLFSLAARRRVSDSTNGFRALRLAMLDDERIDLDQTWLDAYELEPYLLFKAIRLGYRFAEVPVTKIYPPRTLGYTKMKPIAGWWSILRPVLLLGLGLRR